MPAIVATGASPCQQVSKSYRNRAIKAIIYGILSLVDTLRYLSCLLTNPA